LLHLFKAIANIPPLAGSAPSLFLRYSCVNAEAPDISTVC